MSNTPPGVNGHGPTAPVPDELEGAGVAVAPVPTKVSLAYLDYEGAHRMVGITFQTPQGVSVFFLTRETCEALGPDLVHRGRQCSESTLEIARELPREMRP